MTLTLNRLEGGCPNIVAWTLGEATGVGSDSQVNKLTLQGEQDRLGISVLTEGSVQHSEVYPGHMSGKSRCCSRWNRTVAGGGAGSPNQGMILPDR